MNKPGEGEAHERSPTVTALQRALKQCVLKIGKQLNWTKIK
jgi:hypothetical protein